MKYTLNLDERLVNRVVEITGAKTKTEAITKALSEMERHADLTELLKEG